VLKEVINGHCETEYILHIGQNQKIIIHKRKPKRSLQLKVFKAASKKIKGVDMSTDKYGKYILKDDQLRGKKFNPVFQTQEYLGFRGKEHWKDLAFNMGFETITRPWAIDPYPLIHPEADQILAFVGVNAMDLYDFDAEIEICLGEEEEKHIITYPAVIYIPRGMAHCPFIVWKVNKPFLFINTTIGKYTRKMKKNGVWSRVRTMEEERAERTEEEKLARGEPGYKPKL
jgi:hypothetical protein